MKNKQSILFSMSILRLSSFLSRDSLPVTMKTLIDLFVVHHQTGENMLLLSFFCLRFTVENFKWNVVGYYIIIVVMSI